MIQLVFDETLRGLSLKMQRNSQLVFIGYFLRFFLVRGTAILCKK